MGIEQPGLSHLPQLRQLWQQVFGDSDEFLDSFFSTAFFPDHCRCVMAGQTLAAALYWIDCTLAGQKLAYLYAVATHPAHRGQGLCRALMADTHRILEQSGYAGVVLVPQEEGLRAMYRKMGYENAGGMTTLSCRAGSQPLPLRAIGPGEFARLRRRLLPADGVLQEDAGLDFLAGQLEFYAGEELLLSGIRQEEGFFAAELLGDPQAAPGILAALGCPRGSFRMAGETPFAMFRPLGPGAPLPRYFAFAFD